MPICAEVDTAIDDARNRGNLILRSNLEIVFEKHAIPNTDEKLIKKLASKSANGANANMKVNASERLFNRSERCPLMSVTRPT